MEAARKGPYQFLSTREVYRNPWVRIREDEVIRPGGKRGPFAVIEMRHGATVLAMDEAGEVYFVREYKYAVERETLELVSGGIDDGEDPLEAARRELKEEAGLEAERWESLGVVDPFTTMLRAPNHMFLARGLRETGAAPDEGEVLHVVRVPFAKALEMAMNGEISHAASCLAILKAARLGCG